jgi:hypothetical protein
MAILATTTSRMLLGSISGYWELILLEVIAARALILSTVVCCGRFPWYRLVKKDKN